MRVLAGEDVPPDLPVEHHEFAVDGEPGANLSRPNSLLELSQKLSVPGRRWQISLVLSRKKRSVHFCY